MKARNFLATLGALLIALCLVTGAVLVAMVNLGGQPSTLLSAVRGERTFAQASALFVQQIKANYGFVGPVIVTQDGYATVQRTFFTPFEGKSYDVNITVDPRVYTGAVNAKRKFASSLYKTTEQNIHDFTHAMVNDPAQQPTIDALCKEFRAIKEARQFSDDEYAEFLTKFVQCIPYDYERQKAADENRTLKGDPRFPVQVLADGKGDCDEKSYLLAALLKHEGYGCALMISHEERHMAVGLLSQGQGSFGTGYEFVETTGISYISEKDLEYTGSVRITTAPSIVKISDGLPYSQEAVDQITTLIEVRNAASKASAVAKKKAEQARTKSEFEFYKARYQATIEAQNVLRETVTPDGRQTYSFKDRATAWRWALKNVWWAKL